MSTSPTDVPLARPCLTCGVPTTLGPRCPDCEGAHQRIRNATRPHYDGDYARRAKACRDQANADPTTRCRRCGGLARVSDPWTAGHVVDGDPSSDLAPEHASCNYAAGGRSSRP